MILCMVVTYATYSLLYLPIVSNDLPIVSYPMSTYSLLCLSSLLNLPSLLCLYPLVFSLLSLVLAYLVSYTYLHGLLCLPSLLCLRIVSYAYLYMVSYAYLAS